MNEPLCSPNDNRNDEGSWRNRNEGTKKEGKKRGKRTEERKSEIITILSK
jgi:hypothetical protein